MEEKQCYVCKKVKSISEFWRHKTGTNKGYYYSRCKECNTRCMKEYKYKNPWIKTWCSIKKRCNYRQHRYSKRGIKNCLTKEAVKYLWFRDKAYLMKKPSIDRIDTYGSYTLENCRFIELSENLRRPKANYFKTNNRTKKQEMLGKIVEEAKMTKLEKPEQAICRSDPPDSMCKDCTLVEDCKYRSRNEALEECTAYTISRLEEIRDKCVYDGNNWEGWFKETNKLIDELKEGETDERNKST